MGHFFKMSRKFNKFTAAEFGLIPLSNGLAHDPRDASTWEAAELYDFGWGPENGYCRLPIPSFHELLRIVMAENDADDIYGAAAIITERYACERLSACEQLLFAEQITPEVLRLVKVFNLIEPINRSPIVGKTIAEVSSDMERWRAIANRAIMLSEVRSSFL